MTTDTNDELTPIKKWRSILARLLTWSVTLACFSLIYIRVEKTAEREQLSVIEYISNFFVQADWVSWLMLMIPYSVYFFLVDTHATWRLLRWFNTPKIRYTNILPIRASAYILSLVNEQVGKGAMSLYLLRRYDVPVWKALSSMVMLGLVEIYQLLIFSAIGVFVYYDLVVQASSNLPVLTIVLSVYAVAFCYFPFHILYFKGAIFKNSNLRDKHLFHAFRQAKLKHYVMLLLLKAPNLLGAVVVYTLALSLFKVDVGFGQMVAFLPVIFLAAALPLPFHAGALVLWTVLFPDYPEVSVFSLIMHTFFVLFNAVIGLMFLPKANKELFT
ncbi:MAG: hypothetical protein JKY88_06910 [Pseudomonadales bacterium]|nr:hypothetical protein [Pseudomonadales bacterium]